MRSNTLASHPDSQTEAIRESSPSTDSTPPATGRTRLAVAFVLAGSALSAGLAAVANWVAANGLGAAGFGLFSLAMAITTVLQEIGGPALDTAIVRYAGPLVKRDPQRAEIYFRAGARIKLLVSGTLALALYAGAEFIAHAAFDEPELTSLIGWMALSLLAANVSTNTLARLQSAERFVAHSAFRILANGTKVLLLGGLLVAGLLTPDTAAFSWALSFVVAYVAGVLYCRAWRIGVQPQAGDRPHRDIVRFGGWVMLSGVLFAVHMRTDMLLLGYYAEPAEVGDYAVAWNLMLLIDIITSSLIVALLPRAARATTALQLSRLRRTTLLTAAGIALLLLPLYLFAEPLLHLLFPDYPGAIAPFRLLYWSSIVVLLIFPLYLGFYAQNRPGKVTGAYVLMVVVGILIGLVLIPAHGAMGAATATLIARIAGASVILMLLLLDRPHSART